MSRGDLFKEVHIILSVYGVDIVLVETAHTSSIGYWRQSTSMCPTADEPPMTSPRKTNGERA